MPRVEKPARILAPTASSRQQLFAGEIESEPRRGLIQCAPLAAAFRASRAIWESPPVSTLTVVGNANVIINS